jgi:hypothetical protein
LRNFIQSVSAADLKLDLLLTFFLLGLTGQSKTFAKEVRAIVPLAKGTEDLFCYKFRLLERADRRQFFSETCQFDCNCELCALPDDLSNNLDTKIMLANDAAKYLERFFARKEPECDSRRSVS